MLPYAEQQDSKERDNQQVSCNKQRFAVLIKLICLLNKTQAPEQAPQPVNGLGLVITAQISLKGTHGIKCVKIITVLAQQTVIGKTAPLLTNNLPGKRTVERIGMGQAAVVDCNQGSVTCFAASLGNGS